MDLAYGHSEAVKSIWNIVSKSRNSIHLLWQCFPVNNLYSICVTVQTQNQFFLVLNSQYQKAIRLLAAINLTQLQLELPKPIWDNPNVCLTQPIVLLQVNSRMRSPGSKSQLTYLYSKQLSHSTHQSLMMEAERVLEMMESHSILTWLIDYLRSLHYTSLNNLFWQS